MSFIIHFKVDEIFVHRNNRRIIHILKSATYPCLLYIDTKYLECQSYPYLIQRYCYVDIQPSKLQADFLRIVISGLLI